VKQLVSFVIDDGNVADTFAHDLMVNNVLCYTNIEGDEVEIEVSRVSIGPAD
jgi:hypothetical protein